MPRLSTRLLLLLSLVGGAAQADFAWTDTKGQFIELTHDGKPISRYVYEATDETSPERREATSKPYCHLYAYRWNHYGELLTKGPGGKFSHHRGIFYGFNSISYTDPSGKRREHVDTWHGRNACQVHREFTAREADAKSASFVSEIDWVGDDGLPFARETRTMRFSLDGPDVVVDFESALVSKVHDLHLDGDPQHAGFQFRAHNDVNDLTSKATYFIRPGTGIGVPGATVNWSPSNDTESTRDLPWKAMCFTLRDAQTTVVYLDHPGNPRPSRSSERSYGRFGSCFASGVAADHPLRVRYRLVVHPGEYESTSEIEKLSAAFAAVD